MFCYMFKLSMMIVLIYIPTFVPHPVLFHGSQSNWSEIVTHCDFLIYTLLKVVNAVKFIKSE